MKKITDKEYEEWNKFKLDKIHGKVLTPEGLRFICEANQFDLYKIGQHFLEILPKLER